MTPAGGNKRSERARQTRMRMLTAARELFVEHGYGGTTLQDVADRAGVAVQTIYFTFGNKRTLLKELVDVTIAGDDEPVATLDRPWFKKAQACATAAELLRAQVRGSCAVLGRVAPLLEVVRGAKATDPDALQLWPHGSHPRSVIVSAIAAELVTKPDARADLTEAYVRDVLFAMLSPELYLVLVRDRGWSPRQWERWTRDTLHAQFCAG